MVAMNRLRRAARVGQRLLRADVGSMCLQASALGGARREDPFVSEKSGDGSAPQGYSELGMLLVRIAQRHAGNPQKVSAAVDSHVEDSIARRLAEHSGLHFGSREIRYYLSGTRPPPPRFIPAFADTYGLTVRERRLVAWAHAFSETPQPSTLESPPPGVGGDR